MSCSASAIGIRRGCSKSDIMSNSLFVAEQMSFANHLTSENGKLAALTSGRPAFQQHAEHTKSGDTTHALHTRKTMSAGCTNPDFDKSEKDHAAQRGRDAFGTATRISASLSRRLSAFFESTSRPRSQSGKVRRSDTRPGDVCERAEHSEGSNSAPIRNSPCFGV